MGGHSSLLGVSVTKINVSSGIKIDDNLYPSISAAPQNNQSSNGDSMWRSELVEYTFCIYTFWLLSWLPRRSREGFFTTAPNVFLRLFDTREPFFSRLFWGFRRLRKPPELLMAAKRILCHRERIPDWQVIRSNPWLSGLTVKVCLKEKKKKGAMRPRHRTRGWTGHSGTHLALNKTPTEGYNSGDTSTIGRLKK